MRLSINFRSSRKSVGITTQFNDSEKKDFWRIGVKKRGIRKVRTQQRLTPKQAALKNSENGLFTDSTIR